MLMAQGKTAMIEEGEILDAQVMQRELRRSGWWLSLLRTVVEAGCWTLPEYKHADDGVTHLQEGRKDRFYAAGPQGALLLVEVQSVPTTLLTPLTAQ